jgi:hypothetical protein
MRRGPLIEACRLEGIGDDFINIGGFSDDDGGGMVGFRGGGGVQC